ncbi:MAG: hypothetical protein UU51_C0013G0009 [Microgenomates group bacterium GW2011_GWC1_41_20]|uniref:Gluconeogenesis factor n=4 Tax=Candidatus Woeseibacteriota TaxID=1752722 RepID=A0A0G0WTC9_9BACT|nr:MAG: hypothetical protein UU39_C0020G0006 [Candidatus Woesebacteria bacterium GW2011_GWD1_41_12]KKS00274.1 MAG: hypothetical protein UU51_C0013G0009 [Microgenomates group bacterium GW2011_GWC1_41_20]KKS04673.1 MAG: hypothetical protein UU57_C0018G0005 [Candidatus Woesebacteria bacterium GW2011_GWE1_41_24]KKS16060.1 MAG: hypothetical protein UU74_C0049G0012 [Candidatus Woesebacteria bacterium GW2011_GWA1_41_7]
MKILAKGSDPSELKFTKRMNKTPNIVIIGGGTGSYVLASGLSDSKVHISMLMTMVDDGGSNRVIRDEFGLLPTSGIRQAILALSKNKTVLRKLFTYRYHQGGAGLDGMTFGNLFMAAMADIMGSQKKGIEETCRLLQVKGDIFPISYDNVRLVAEYIDGTEAFGEHNIDVPKCPGLRIKNLKTKPSAKINPEAEKAIREADLIIIGPGDFYTNTIANLVVDGVVTALKKSKGEILFIANLMDSCSETPQYCLSDFFDDLKKYMPLELVKYVLVNSNNNYPKSALEAYAAESTYPIKDNLQVKDINPDVKIIREDLISDKVPEKQKGDSLDRSMIRHDSEKLRKEILKIVGLAPRL